MTSNSNRWIGILSAVAIALLLAGCGKKDQATTAGGPPAAGDGTVYCDFKGGIADAPVKVVAYFPGRHEDTLALVKDLLRTFPDDVSVEIVDWRSPEGLKRRNDDGFSCGTIAINGKNAFDLEIDGKASKVLFVRGVDGEWTAEDLLAAVKQAIAAAKKQ